MRLLNKDENTRALVLRASSKIIAFLSQRFAAIGLQTLQRQPPSSSHFSLQSPNESTQFVLLQPSSSPPPPPLRRRRLRRCRRVAVAAINERDSNRHVARAPRAKRSMSNATSVAAVEIALLGGALVNASTCDSPWPSCISVTTAFVTIACMLVVMLVIVCGNLLVVLTVHNDNKLRSQRQNWLIGLFCFYFFAYCRLLTTRNFHVLVSLAVADLLVGLLVMPLTMAYEVIGLWVLGDILCELYVFAV